MSRIAMEVRKRENKLKIYETDSLFSSSKRFKFLYIQL